MFGGVGSLMLHTVSCLYDQIVVVDNMILRAGAILDSLEMFVICYSVDILTVTILGCVFTESFCSEIS